MSKKANPIKLKDLDDALDQVERAIAAADLAHAVSLAQAALASGLRHPLFYNLEAYGLEEAGRFSQALASLRLALELAPNDPQTLHAAGLCLNKQARSVEALAAFEAALRQRPGFAPTLHHMGVALEALGDDAAAERHYRAAAEGDERFPDPLAGLASVLGRRGRTEEARGLATRALSLDPNSTPAIMALAAADLADGQPQDAERRLQRALEQPNLYAPDRGAMINRLGDALDAQQKIDAAFTAYVESKAAYADAYAPMMAESPDFLAMTDRIAGHLGALERWPAADAAADGPRSAAAHVFLVSFPRSGTTLLEQVLATHPEVVTLSERSTLDALGDVYLTREDGWDKLMALDGEGLNAARDFYWESLDRAGLDVVGKVFIDKLPLNTLKLPLIAKLFPKAKILFAERDPRDVVWSCFHHSFSMNAAMAQFTSLEKTARFYDAVMRLALAARAKLPLDLHTVRYEAVVSAFDEKMKAVCAFLGLEWVEGMKDFAAAAADRAIATPSASQVRRGLYQDGAGQWRRYADHLQPVLPMLAPWVQKFGYAP